jgi:hypothetical protein
MGVSISWSAIKHHDVTPGARSKAAALLRDNGFVGVVRDSDSDALAHLAMHEEDNEIRKMIAALCDAAVKHGEIVVTLDY